MTDFKIRRGLSSDLFLIPGVPNPKLVIEEGCWYLCTDTAELYIGFKDKSNKLTLRQINGRAGEGTNFDPSSGTADTELFIKIPDEESLPKDFDSELFNPNVTYYIPILDDDGNESGRVLTYIFDIDERKYVCTNVADEVVIRALVIDAINNVLDDTFAEKLPQAIKDTIETVILFGGKASL